MNPRSEVAYIAFDGDRRIADGDLPEVARAAKAVLDRHADASVLVFVCDTSRPIDLDFRGTVDDVLARLPAADGMAHAASDTEPDPAPNRGPGRPKLGVVAREITLLPRHWEWLAQQPGGASVAIRKLVEEARRNGEHGDRIRSGQEAAYRFMSAMAGNRPHFEDAVRALFAPDPVRFATLISGWPADIRRHAAWLADRVFHDDVRAPAG
jgi:uncharacterized protein